MEQAADVAFCPPSAVAVMHGSRIDSDEVLLDEAWRDKIGPPGCGHGPVCDFWLVLFLPFPSYESCSSVSTEDALTSTLAALACGNEQTFIVHAYPLRLIIY
jgi:hypothetical protein